MNKTFKLKSLLLSMVVAGAATASIAPTAAQAGVSANVGVVSNYIFRGVAQSNFDDGDGSTTSAPSASVGLDYEDDSGLYIGTWVADVERGLEYDLYAGWGGNFDDVAVGIGGTYYGYTHEAFDTSYTELNLSLGYEMFSVGYDLGKYEDGNGPGDDADYDHMYVSAEYESFSATIGQLDGNKDADDDKVTYIDLGFSTELAAGIDGSVNYINSSYEESGKPSESFLVFGLSKSFDIM